jgi:hypothetical protein
MSIMKDNNNLNHFMSFHLHFAVGTGERHLHLHLRAG